eukprot:2067598-Pyramimonas_sp.AAC.1
MQKKDKNSLDVWGDYVSWVEQKVDFLRRELNAYRTVCTSNHMVNTVMKKKDYLTMFMQKLVVMEGLKFTMPYEKSSAEAANYPWLLSDDQSHRRVSWMDCPMGTSVTFKKAKNEAAKKAEAAAKKKAKEEQAYQKKVEAAIAAGKHPPKEKARTSNPEDGTIPLEEVKAEVDGRMATALDFIAASVFGPLKMVPEDKIDVPTVRRGLRLSLQFLWAKTVTINGETFGAWSKVRKVIRAEMIKGHVAQLCDSDEQARKIRDDAEAERKGAGGAEGGADNVPWSEQLANRLVAQLAADDDADD